MDWRHRCQDLLSSSSSSEQQLWHSNAAAVTSDACERYSKHDNSTELLPWPPLMKKFA